MGLKELWYSDAYKQLREETEGRLCFICLSGSYGYGTNVEGSDYDIRGVMLPTKEELIGLNHFEQRIDNETDTTIYEFNKFIKLAMANNPNVIELLGCKEYLVFNEVGFMLLDAVDKMLSKRCINTFGGYAVAQLRRLENALSRATPEKRLEQIKQTMDVAIQKLKDKNELFEKDKINIDVDDKGLYISLNVEKAPIGTLRAALNDISTIESSYDRLNGRNKKKDAAHLNKHIMHLIRLYLTCFDILEKQKMITYREKDREFLLEVRKGKFIKDGKLTDDFYPYLETLKERMEKDIKETKLQDKPDMKYINNLVMEVNTKVIKDEVETYDEPQKVRFVYNEEK